MLESDQYDESGQWSGDTDHHDGPTLTMTLPPLLLHNINTEHHQQEWSSTMTESSPSLIHTLKILIS